MIVAISVKQPGTKDGRDLPAAVLEIPNVVLTIDKSQAKGFYQYFEDFVVKANQEDERNGTLEFLDSALKTKLFTLKLSNLGIVGIRNARIVTGSEVIARVSVEFYCEEMAFSSHEESLGGAVTSSETTTSPMVAVTSALSPAKPFVESLMVVRGRCRAHHDADRGFAPEHDLGWDRGIRTHRAAITGDGTTCGAWPVGPYAR